MMENYDFPANRGDFPCVEMPLNCAKWSGSQKLEIEGTVGAGRWARNLPGDILTMKVLFNRVAPHGGGPLPLLKITERWDADLQDVIYKFQGKWLRYFGGVIEPNGQTMELLNFGEYVALTSELFRRDHVFERCLVRIPAGEWGPHIGKIHTALFALDGYSVAPGELMAERYGASTVDGVAAYKRTRNILNRTTQLSLGEVIGKFTVASMDAEMFRYEQNPYGLPARSTFSWTTRRGR